MNRYKKHNRLWLNPAGHYNTGAMSWSVSSDQGFGYAALSGSISFWDCSKKIVLNFDCDNETDCKINALKLNKIIIEVGKMRDAMAEAFASVDFSDKEEDDG